MVTGEVVNSTRTCVKSSGPVESRLDAAFTMGHQNAANFDIKLVLSCTGAVNS